MARDFSSLRTQMVQRYITPVISDDRIIQAFLKILRHLFVPDEYQPQAYEDMPLPIGHGQTISQPSLVAEMTALLQLTGNEKVLEVGTGSGYQAAILSLLAKKVYTIERIPELAQKARAVLSKLNCTNVTVIMGNGIGGLPGKAPFDAIIVTASGPQIPKPLLAQLKDRGRIVIPIVEKDGDEKLKIGMKKNKHIKFSDAGFVRFVPLIGQHGFPLEVKK